MELQPAPETVRAGQPISFTISATGSAERPPNVFPAKIDGRYTGPVEQYACVTPPDSPPPRRPQQAQRVFEYTFSPGRHTVEVHAESGCSYYMGEATRTYVIVAESEPESQPSASEAA